MESRAERQTDGRTERQADGRTERQTDGRTDVADHPETGQRKTESVRSLRLAWSAHAVVPIVPGFDVPGFGSDVGLLTNFFRTKNRLVYSSAHRCC